MNKEEYEKLITTLNWWNKITKLLIKYHQSKMTKQQVKTLQSMIDFTENIINKNEETK